MKFKFCGEYKILWISHCKLQKLWIILQVFVAAIELKGVQDGA